VTCDLCFDILNVCYTQNMAELTELTMLFSTDIMLTAVNDSNASNIIGMLKIN